MEEGKMKWERGGNVAVRSPTRHILNARRCLDLNGRRHCEDEAVGDCRPGGDAQPIHFLHMQASEEGLLKGALP